jgi:hypothetical protein
MTRDQFWKASWIVAGLTLLLGAAPLVLLVIQTLTS